MNVAPVTLDDVVARIERLEAVMSGSSGIDVFEREAATLGIGPPTVRRVVELASWHTGVPSVDILGPHREQHIVRVRDAVAWVARHALQLSYPTIGGRLNRDHTSIITAVSRAETRRHSDPAFRLLIGRIQHDLNEEGLMQ